MIVLITTHAEDTTGHLATSSSYHVNINQVRDFLMFYEPISCPMTVDDHSYHETAHGCHWRA